MKARYVDEHIIWQPDELDEALGARLTHHMKPRAGRQREDVSTLSQATHEEGMVKLGIVGVVTLVPASLFVGASLKQLLQHGAHRLVIADGRITHTLRDILWRRWTMPLDELRVIVVRETSAGAALTFVSEHAEYQVDAPGFTLEGAGALKAHIQRHLAQLQGSRVPDSRARARYTHQRE